MESELQIMPNNVKRQRMMETTKFVHMPDEIVDEILSTLPVKSLLRFKCVCKLWLSKISSVNFRHKKEFDSILVMKSETRTVSLHLIDDSKVVTESFSVLCNEGKYDGKKTFISNSCNGLVIIGLGESFFLFNPSTRYLVKVLELNILRHNSVVVAGLCYDASTNDYKVVIRFTDNWYRHSKVVVAASLKTKRWVKINFPFDVASTKGGPVLNGRMHWTVNYGVNQLWSSKKIICFDPRTNLFKEFPSPQSNFGEENAITGLGVLGECLCIVRRKRQTFQVLIMKEYGVGESWTTMTTVSLFSPPFHFTKNGEILGKSGCQVFAHNPRKNTKRKFDLPILNYLSSNAVSLVQNLASPVGYEWDEIRHGKNGSFIY